MMLAPHDTFHDHYQISYLVDQQPGCVLYRAYDQHAARSMLMAELAHADEDELQATAELVAAVAVLDIEGLLPLHEHFADGERYYLLIDDPGGQDLARAIHSRAYGVEPGIQAAQQCERLLALVAALHQHQPPFLLGDLHAADIWLSEAGELTLAPSALTRPPGAGETPYRAPELDDQDTAPAAASDVYALGAVCYHLLTGWTPPTAAQRAAGTPLSAPRFLDARLASPHEKVILRALQLQATERYETVRELHQAMQLANILQEIEPDDATTPAAPPVTSSEAPYAPPHPPPETRAELTAVEESAPLATLETIDEAAPQPQPQTGGVGCLMAVAVLLLLLAIALSVAGWYFLLGPGSSLLTFIAPEHQVGTGTGFPMSI
jgi:hypothetical protein